MANNIPGGGELHVFDMAVNARFQKLEQSNNELQNSVSLILNLLLDKKRESPKPALDHSYSIDDLHSVVIPGPSGEATQKKRP